MLEIAVEFNKRINILYITQILMNASLAPAYTAPVQTNVTGMSVTVCQGGQEKDATQVSHYYETSLYQEAGKRSILFRTEVMRNNLIQTLDNLVITLYKN